MHHCHIAAREAHYHLFYFLFAVTPGTLLGGTIGDRTGRERVIWLSLLGVIQILVQAKAQAALTVNFRSTGPLPSSMHLRRVVDLVLFGLLVKSPR
jgi:nitrate/nitrite transporter NarK